MHSIIIILNVVFLLFVSGWVWKKQTPEWRKLYWPAWAVKILAGIALGIIYSTYYESSDTFLFYEWSVDKAKLANTDFPAYLSFLFSSTPGYFLGEHRTILLIKITSVFAWLSHYNYWIISMYCSIISFFAAWHLTKTIARLFPSMRVAACIAFLFFPGVVFWSSGLIKESLAMTALFYVTAVFVRLWMRERISIWTIIPIVLAFWLIFNIKYYYLAVFIPTAASALIVRWLTTRIKIARFSVQLLLWMFLLICGLVLITFLHPNFAPQKLLTVIIANNTLFMEVCAPDDVIHFYNPEPTWASMLINSPWALVSGMFRPFVWEANTIFKMVTALQNLVLIVFTVLSLMQLKRLKDSPHRLLIFSVMLYVVVLSVFLALSTPNFGTLTRYNVGYLPFVVLLVMQHPFVNRLVSRIL